MNGWGVEGAVTQGAELLIADSVDRDREGLRRMFDAEGYLCTAVKNNEEVRSLVQNKFFPVAIVDLDLEKLNGGLDLARFIAEKSSPTKIILLTSRSTFEPAAGAVRPGLLDIVSKHPDQISYLSGAVRKAVEQYQAGDKDSTLPLEVRSVMEEAIKTMVAMYKRIYGDESSVSITGPVMKPMILIIDEDRRFLREVAQQVVDTDWEVSVELSGSAGLDKASTFAFQIVAVSEELTDLPGQILIKSVQAQQEKTLGLLYSKSGGRLDRYDEGKRTGSDKMFMGAEQLVSKLGQLVDELATMRRERRYVQAFGSEHAGFLKRYAKLKVRIDSLSGVTSYPPQAPAPRPASLPPRTPAPPPASYPPQAPAPRPASLPPRTPASPPASYPPRAPAPRPASLPPRAPAPQPVPAPEAERAQAQTEAAGMAGPPARTGGTLVGYSVPQELKETYGAAREMKRFEAGPARVSSETEAVAPEAPAPAGHLPSGQVSDELIAVKPAQFAPAPVSLEDKDLPLKPDTGFLRKLTNKKWLAGRALLVLVAAGVLVYRQYLMETPASVASTAMTGIGELQPGAAGAGAETFQSGQPRATPEPPQVAATETPAVQPDKAEEAVADRKSEQAATEPAGQPDKAEKAMADQKPEQAATEPAAETEPRLVRMVPELLRISGGKIDQDEVMKAAESAYPRMERCYDRALKLRPRLKGRVVLFWAIQTSGRAIRARRAGGTIQNRPFARCLAGAISGTRFPRPTGRAALVRLPFIFGQPVR